MKTDDYIEEIKQLIEEDKNEFDEYLNTDIRPIECIEATEIYEVCIGNVKVSGTNIAKIAKVAVILAAYNRVDNMIDFDDRKEAIKDIDDAIGPIRLVNINNKNTGETEL